MTRAAAIFGSAVFLVIAPGFIAGLVPWWISHWRFEPPFFGVETTRALGGLLLDAGAIVLLDAFARFAWQGLGTPAPVAAPRRLVVTGLYRFVRNPMYLAVASVIFGQALLFGNATLLGYGAAVCVAFHLFVVSYEEPTLRSKFGAEYEQFRAQVPRWIPRLSSARRSRRR